MHFKSSNGLKVNKGPYVKMTETISQNLDFIEHKHSV